MATPKSYGICYMGTKNALAERIVALLPSASHLIDVFAGGCAVTHCAMKSGKWQHVHANDINEMIVGAFLRAINGEFIGERRWVSHEEFNRVRDTDAYAAICFSFGGVLYHYAYNPQREQLLRAFHFAIYYGDASFFLDMTGIDLTPVLNIADLRERAIAASRIVREMKKNDEDKILTKLPPHNIQNHCRLNRISADFSEEQRKRLTIGSVDFAEVEIPSNSVVYCDPPYRGTGGYLKAKRFNHERFYDWALRQTVPVFVSEYAMPEDFVEVAAWQKVCSMSRNTAPKATTEKLFVPRWQANDLGFRTE